MGIENIGCSHLAPHYPSWGSKKVFARHNSHQSSHYPSWGSKTLDAVAPPLMGIENADAFRSRDMPHYPSWGSKTGGYTIAVENRTTGARSHASISLPLMGIENTWYSISLPLMGIENNSHGHPAHYPSWGSKTGEPAPQRQAHRATTHYPSWGSKTATSGTCVANPMQTRSHYPSWGSKTVPPPCAHQVARLKLITPHGDRKPPVSRENVTVCGALCEATYHRGRATHHHSKVFVRLNHGVQRVLCSGARRSQTSDQFFPCH